MSLKRRPKIQHSSSPKVSVQKQNDEEMFFNSQLQANKQNSTEYFLLKKMQQKIGKILKAYQKLQDQSKRKDQVIKQLQNENSLLKERLVEKSTETTQPRFETRSHVRKDPIQEHVIQRTFTPMDIKIQQKLPTQQFLYKPTDFSNPTVSTVRQYEGLNQYNRLLLKQSRSLENLNKTTVPYQSKFEPGNIPELKSEVKKNEDENKIFSKRDENRAFKESLDQDKSFIDVLGKLKEKIRRFDEEDAQNTKKTAFQKDKSTEEISNQGLSRVKSSHIIARRPFTFTDKPEEVQTQALKKIWNQRDEQIKRMDELFSKIDERINVIEKQ